MIYRKIDTGIAAAVEHKSAKTADATVVSIRAVGASNLQKDSTKTGLYNVCFKIDGCDQIEAEMRVRYQSAEAQREAREGPRCKTTADSKIVTHLNAGDKLKVVYLLENNYKIDVISMTAYDTTL